MSRVVPAVDGADTPQHARGPSPRRSVEGAARVIAPGVALLLGFTIVETYVLWTWGAAVMTVLVWTAQLLIGAGFLILVAHTFRARDVERAAVVDTALANVPQGIMMIGPDDRVLLINRQALKLLDLPDRFGEPGVMFRDIVAYQLAQREFSKPGAEISDDLHAHIKKLVALRDHPNTYERYERTRANGVTIEVITRSTGDGGFVRTFEDVTHRRKLEADLRAREREARTLARIAEVTPHYITVTDMDRKITWANPAFCSSVGLPLDEVVGRTVDVLVHLDSADAPRIASAIQRVHRGEATAVLYDRRLSDGRTALVSSSINPLLDEDGRVTGVVSVVTDVTELHAAEVTLRRQQSLLEEMSELAEVGAWDVDLRTQRLTWSRETRAIHEVGDDFEPTIARAIGFYHVDAQPKITAAVEAAIAHGRAFDLELPLRTANGRDIWVRARGRAEFENGVAVRVVGAFQDVTEARAAAAENRLLAELARQTPNGFVLMDETGVIRWINEGYTRMSGFTLADVAGKMPLEVFDGKDTDPDTVARVLAARARVEPYAAEVLNYRKSGEPYWVSIAGSPLRDENGAFMGFIAIETDISERKRHEEIAARYQNDLERYSYVASHDLQEPLRKISTHAQLLVQALADDDREEVARCADVVVASARRGRDIVSDLLRFAKLKDRAVARAPTRIDGIVAEIADQSRDTAPVDRLVLRTDLAPLTIDCDDGLIRQVVQNLVGNAVKYGKKDVAVTVDVALRRVAATGDAVLTIADDGIGFDMTHATRIFEPFQRLVKRGDYAGTGIGLSLVKAILDKHGWSVAVESAPGIGSTFTVTIPARDVVATPEDAVAA